MKTQEEILIGSVGKDLFDNLSKEMIYPHPSGSFPLMELLYSAMEEYATQQSIAFAEWITENQYVHCDNKEWWNFFIDEKISNTTSELYTLFTQSIKQVN